MMLAQKTAKATKKVTDTTPASAPTNISWSSPAPDTLVVSWTPGKDAESAVLGTDVSVNGVLAGRFGNSAMLTGLTKDTAYTIALSSVSGGGASSAVSVQAHTVRYAVLDGWPQPLDDIHDAMRPKGGFVWSALVNPDGAGDYTSVKAAADAAYAANNNRTPTTRAVIFVKDGTYAQPDTTLHEQTAIVGVSGDPTKVIIENVTSASVMENGGRGAIDTWGSSWVEGVTPKRVNTDAAAGTLSNPKYTVHGTSGDCSVWANCIFDYGQSTNGYGMPSIFGQDGGDGHLTVFYKSKFIGSRSDADTNIHAGAGDGTPGKPEQVAYVGCTWTTTNVADTAPYPTPSGAFGFKPLDDKRQDDALWIVDCTVPCAQMIGGAGGIVHKPASIPMTGLSNPGTIDTRQDWPQPVGWKAP